MPEPGLPSLAFPPASNSRAAIAGSGNVPCGQLAAHLQGQLVAITVGFGAFLAWVVRQLLCLWLRRLAAGGRRDGGRREVHGRLVAAATTAIAHPVLRLPGVVPPRTAQLPDPDQPSSSGLSTA
jgi:hypothetical protein